MIESVLNKIVEQGSGLAVWAAHVPLKNEQFPAITYSVRSISQEKRPDTGVDRFYSIDFVVHTQTYESAKKYQEILLDLLTYLDVYEIINERQVNIKCDSISVNDLYAFGINQINVICDFTVFEFPYSLK